MPKETRKLSVTIDHLDTKKGTITVEAEVDAEKNPFGHTTATIREDIFIIFEGDADKETVCGQKIILKEDVRKLVAICIEGDCTRPTYAATSTMDINEAAPIGSSRAHIDEDGHMPHIKIIDIPAHSKSESDD